MKADISIHLPDGLRPVRGDRRGRLPSKRARGWLTILAAALLLALFMFVIGPMGLEAPYFKPIADYIEERGINANGYYYSDVPEFADAERNMQYTMDYMPKR
jgi:hypothetical protein